MPKQCSTALWVLAVVALTAASQGVSQLKRVAYLPSDEIIQNPERGFTITNSTGMVAGQVTPYEPLEADWLQQVARAQRLVFRYFGLKAWRTTDIPAEILQKIDDDFAAIRAAGLKCIPRFTYSADIGEPDAPLSIILRHLDQLKPILRKNKDVIAVMQAGFIGAWGEWHSSTNNNETLEHKRAVLMKVLEVLPVDRMVQLRTPRYKQEIFGLPFDSTAAIPPSRAFSGEPLARVGHHNDCFLADANDAGTYWRNNRIDTALAKPYLRLDNRYVPMGGETCRLSEFAHCPNALSELAPMRWSFLSASWREEVIARFAAEGCLDVRESDVIKIVVKSKNPKEAALLANLYAIEYYNRNVYKSREKSRSLREFLQLQVDEQRENLERLEGALQSYMEKKGIIALDAESRKMIDQLSESGWIRPGRCSSDRCSWENTAGILRS